MATGGNYYSDKDLCDAVRAFHDRKARQPVGQDLKSAKAMLETLKTDLRREMAVQGVFLCTRFEYRGSTYEGVKVKKTPTDSDLEFDIMFVIEGGTDLTATAIPGRPGYALLKPKPGKENRAVFQRTTVNGVISAEKLLREFYSHLSQIIKSKFPYVQVRSHGPAIQLDVLQNGAKFFSVDMAPHFDLKPAGPNEIYVPKLAYDRQRPEAWLRSYSLEERRIFDGMDRDNGCRKMVLRIVKTLRFQCAELRALKSNQLKTVLLNEVRAQSSWKQDQLGLRLMGFLERLEGDLSNGRMDHYYIPGMDLFNLTPIVMENMRDRIRRLLRRKEDMLALLAR